MEQIYNSQPSEPKKLPPMTYECPMPTAMLPFLKKKGIQYRLVKKKSMLSNIVFVEIDIRDGFDITNIIYAAWEHGFDDKAEQVKHHYSFKNKAA